MAALRTDGYDHLHKAVSELGSLDAPRRWLFNLAGYILPGLLIAYFSVGLRKHWPGRHRFFTGMLALSGLLMAMAGVFPMDMANRQAPVSVLHTLGSLGSGLAWILCTLASWRALRSEPAWRNLAWPLSMLPVGVVLLMVLTPPDMPALAQRFSFLGYFGFVVALAWRAKKTATHSSERASSRSEGLPT